MRILILSPHYPPDVAATGQLAEELVEDLVAASHDVTVITASPSYSSDHGNEKSWGMVSREVRKGATVFWIRSPAAGRRGVWSRLTPFVTYFAGAATVMPIAGPFDAVYAMSTPPVLGGILAAAHKALRSSRFVYNLQDVYPEIAVALGVVRPGLLSRLVSGVEGRLRRYADALTVLGEDMRERIEDPDQARDNVTVIPNWTDTQAVHPVPKDRNPFVKAHGLEDKFVVLYSGNLGRVHGAEVLPDVAEGIAQLSDAVLLVVGDGPMKAQVTEEVERRGLSNVRFLPYQPKKDLALSLSAADVSLVLQREESLGLVVPSKLYGILASGRAAVAAVPERSEVARVLRTHRAGVVVPPLDGRALAEAIEQLYGDRPAVEAMGQRAREAAVAAYSRQACTGQYVDLFNRLAG